MQTNAASGDTGASVHASSTICVRSELVDVQQLREDLARGCRSRRRGARSPSAPSAAPDRRRRSRDRGRPWRRRDRPPATAARASSARASTSSGLWRTASRSAAIASGRRGPSRAGPRASSGTASRRRWRRRCCASVARRERRARRSPTGSSDPRRTIISSAPARSPRGAPLARDRHEVAPWRRPAAPASRRSRRGSAAPIPRRA